MAGLDPATHAIAAKQASHAGHRTHPSSAEYTSADRGIPGVGGRVKPGHDVLLEGVEGHNHLRSVHRPHRRQYTYVMAGLGSATHAVAD